MFSTNKNKIMTGVISPPSVTYSVHPSISRSDVMVKNLPKTTGRSLEEWTALLNAACPGDEKIREQFLKTQYKLGGDTSYLIAYRSVGKAMDISDPATYLREAVQYVEAMYDGKKSQLRPLHDALTQLVLSVGDDVKICPCQTIVPIYRKNVFAQIKPTTLTRLDFGLALKGCEEPFPDRLIDTGGLRKGDRITHRFAIQSLKDIDEEVLAWARRAYALNG